MAAPVVSGAVARLIKNNPDITPKEVKIWMKSCCKKINVPSENRDGECWISESLLPDEILL